jgi:dynein heavy chain, axonemal
MLMQVSTGFDINASTNRSSSSSSSGSKQSDTYYTLSRAGITHFRNSDSDFTSLDRWEREFILFHRIKSINFFKKYRQWKSFTVWKRAIKASKFRESSEAVQKKLFSFNAPLRKALLGIRAACVEVGNERLFAMQAGSTITLETFLQRQAAVQQRVAQLLRDFSAKVQDMVRASTDEVVEVFLKANNIVADHKMTFMERASLRSECRKLTRFLRLVDFSVIDTLRGLVLESVEEAAGFVKHRDICIVKLADDAAKVAAEAAAAKTVLILQSAAKPAAVRKSPLTVPLFQVSANFSDDGRLVIVPALEEFENAFQQV